MKTTLNPFENAKRTANGTGGGVSPAVIEEMQAEISILGSQNETQAQDITDIKGSLKSINDNLTTSNQTAGVKDVPFRFGCTDDGKFGYIINQGGADSVIPFNSLVDINANYSSQDMYVYVTHNEHPLIPIKGYSKIGLYRLSNNGNIKYRFKKEDGTYTSQVAIALSTTPQEVDIPQNAVLIEFEGVDGNWSVFYGLKV